MYRGKLPIANNGQFLRKQQIRMLRIFLGTTTFLYVWGVTFSTVILLNPSLPRGNPTGGILAIGLGLAALAWLAVKPDKPGPATLAAIAATPAVMAFHVMMEAELACLIAPMFLAMYLRAFYPPRAAGCLVAVLTLACVVALAVAPAPKQTTVIYVIVACTIIGAAESFGFLMRALVTAACTDPLTGLFNRAGWEIATADLLGRHSSADVTITVVALDIDDFKLINDTYGHRAGDRHLMTHAERWQAASSGNTVLARLGGDEFAACIADTTSVTAKDFIRSVQLGTPDTSIGTASQPGDLADLDELHSRADAALYAAKGKRLHDQG